MKRMIAMMLLICLLASYLAVGALASGIMPRYYRPVSCNTNGTNFRRTPSTSGDIIGQFMRNDQLFTATDPGYEWYYGFAGISTAIYQKFGDVKGYSVSRAFDEIE